MADDVAADVAMAAQLAKNRPYIAAGANNFSTTLQPEGEAAFGQWVKQNNVPFDPSQSTQDYDMRGFYQALQNKDPRAMTAINPNDQQMHYPDYWKTPYHKSFSNESQWADPKTAPAWNEEDQLVLPNGTVVYDERAANGR